MAQTFSYTRLSVGGLPQSQINQNGTVNFSQLLFASCVGPATSVSDGMTIDLSTDLKTKCYGGYAIGRESGDTATYAIECIPATSYTSSATKLRVVRRSTGALLSAAVSLTAEKWLMVFFGY